MSLFSKRRPLGGALLATAAVIAGSVLAWWLVPREARKKSRREMRLKLRRRMRSPRLHTTRIPRGRMRVEPASGEDGRPEPVVRSIMPRLEANSVQ